MLNSPTSISISPLKLAKTFVSSKLIILKKVVKKCKRSKPNRKFSGFDGKKSSFASMELSNQLKFVFEFIDANGDGKISPLELSEFLLCLGHDKTRVKEEVHCMLKHMDANGDGFVDLNEYMDVVMMGEDNNKNDVNDNKNHFQHDDEDHDGLEDAFQVFDCDKNGLISAKELQKVLKRLGFVNCSLKECGLMIKGVDKDGDGFVNFDEFRLMMMAYVKSS